MIKLLTNIAKINSADIKNLILLFIAFPLIICYNYFEETKFSHIQFYFTLFSGLYQSQNS